MTNLDKELINYLPSNSPTTQYMLDEIKRQDENIELIASENFVSDAVRAACASVFTNKYAEGYPEYVTRISGRSGRYYGGCENVDKLEEYCCNKWRDVFQTDYHVNVQPHSGSQANAAMYMALCKPGDTILALDLASGGHLSHGSPVNFSGQVYNFVHYGLDQYGWIDYNNFYDQIIAYEPTVILTGASAYSRIISFHQMYNLIQVAKDVVNRNRQEKGNDTPYEPYFCVDMAHIAGLIAAGDHPTPFGLADVITTTTHKTLRGPRGALIFCKPYLAKKIDGAVFPGNQGGPLEHIIMAKAIAAEEDCTPEYHQYIHNVVANTAAMAHEFSKLGYDVVTGGTDNHLFMLDFTRRHPTWTGKWVQDTLDKYHITLNKNCVPNETRKPSETSGVRIGCAAMTTKGYTKEDFIKVAHDIDNILKEESKKLEK